MEIVNFLISINKISLLAFFITLGFIIYEIVLIKKEKQRLKKISLPQFQEKVDKEIFTKIAVNLEKKKIRNYKTNNIVLIVLILLMVIFGASSFVGFVNLEKSTSRSFLNENKFSQPTPTPLIEFINSKGIKIFNEDFQPIEELELTRLQPGDKIIIGIETIPEVDIDRARIRINKEKWDDEDITTQFSKEKSVFYIEYQIASNDSELKIEAQLHSPEDGWLGE